MAQRWNEQADKSFADLENTAKLLSAEGTIDFNFTKAQLIAYLDTLYAALDSDLIAIAALSTTAFGRSLLELADAAAGRTTLSVDSSAEVDSKIDADIATHEADTTSVHGIVDTSALLDTADIGVSVQAYDADTAKTDVSENITGSWVFDAEVSLDGEVGHGGSLLKFTGDGTISNLFNTTYVARNASGNHQIFRLVPSLNFEGDMSTVYVINNNLLLGQSAADGLGYDITNLTGQFVKFSSNSDFSGDVTNYRGIWAANPSHGGSVASINNLYQINVSGTTADGITIGTFAGIYLQVVNSLGSSATWAIASVNNAPSYHVGVMKLGSSGVASEQLEIVGNVALSGVLYLGSYTVSTLPTTTVRGFIFVNDEAGGATTAFSDGTNWLRSQDRTIVS